MKNNTEILEEMNIADSILRIANDYGLSTEVFIFAVKAMKENPNLSIIEAMYTGYDEWIK